MPLSLETLTVNQFFGFMPFGFPGGEEPTPEQKAEMERQNDLRRMNNQESQHRVNDLLDSLSNDNLSTLRGIIEAVEGCEHGTATGAFINGRITEILRTKHGKCPCGTNHDEALGDLAVPPAESNETDEEFQARLDAARAGALVRIEDLPAEKIIRDHAAGLMKSDFNRADGQRVLTKIIEQMGRDRNLESHETERLTRYGLAYLDEINPNQAAEPKILAAEPANPITAELEAKAKEYGVAFVPLTNEVVCLEGCGRRWVSLEDRMMKRAGKEGCDFCMQKEKWG